MGSPFLSIAHRAARARRWWLLGRPAPYFGRYRPEDLPTPDAQEHGVGALPVWALWREADPLDQHLKQLAAVRVAHGADGLSPVEALWELAHESDAESAQGLTQALARAVAAPARALGSVYAEIADQVAYRGDERLAAAAEVSAARALLSATAEPARDVLDWATLRTGRARRKRATLGDLLRVLRNPSLDDLIRPAADPWPPLRAWREKLGFPFEAETEVAGPDGWFGSWTLRGRERRLIGVAAWPGALRLRFALQGLGRFDVLAEGGRVALLPRDPAAAQCLSALYPLWLCDRLFQERALKSRAATVDTGRLAALSEILLQRLQAAVVLSWAIFDEAREVDAVLQSASLFSEALGVSVPPELGLLLAAPWSSGLSALPSTTLAAAELGRSLRAELDVDYWRNPRVVERLRRIASEAPGAKLAELVPGDLPEWTLAYRLWAEEALGG